MMRPVIGCKPEQQRSESGRNVSRLMRVKTGACGPPSLVWRTRKGASSGGWTPWCTPDEQSEQRSASPGGGNHGRAAEIPAGRRHVHYRRVKRAAVGGGVSVSANASLPSARAVKGGSPGRLADNWPPREVIRKQRLKKPIPATKILW